LFDGLRGIAVLAVLLLHSSELSGRVGLDAGGRFAEAAGGLGVIVFFVISGFLLYRPFAAARAGARPRPSLRRYARRRALRILPAYWIVLTILALFPGVAGVFTGHWWRYYGFLQAYFSRGTSSGIPVAWTLCVEVTFYAGLPLWAWALAHRPVASQRSFLVTEMTALTALALLGLIVQVLAARQSIPAVLGSTLPGESLWFALGMAIAVLSVAERAHPSRPAAVDWLCDRPLIAWAFALGALIGLMARVPAGGIFGLALSVQLPQHSASTLLKLVLEAIVVLALVLPAAFDGRRPGIPRRIVGCRPLVRLGVISYSFYLWHLTIVEFIAIKHLSPSPFSAGGLNLMAHVHSARLTILFLVSLLAAGAIASVSYSLFELPFLRIKARIGSAPAAGR
jgi:peptidoglycan/LPS O-acetylase OafA/YrhL